MHLPDAFYRDLPGWQKIFDYGARTDGQPVYRGFSLVDTETSAGKWIITFSRYNADGTVLKEFTLEGSWDERVSLFLPYAV